MKKIILLAVFSGFLINIKSNQEEELRALWNRIKVIERQINISKVSMEKVVFIYQKKHFQEDLEAIKKTLPEGRGEQIIKDLEDKSKAKK